MTKKNTLMAVAIAFALVVACRKSDYPCDDFDNSQHKPFLKEIVHGTRHYLFYYDPAGFVDSIRAVDVHTTYLYRIAHHGKRIDSVSLVQNGVVVSTNGNIQYDHKGKIIQYTYTLNAVPGTPPVLVTLTYEQGHIKTIAKSGLMNSVDTLLFNGQHNLMKWTENYIHSPLAVTTFTYDPGVNPLYYIDDLFVMFTEESFFWEFIFSQHNSTSKERQQYGVEVTNYVNRYDPHGRLVKKLMEVNSLRDSLEFRYIH